MASLGEMKRRDQVAATNIQAAAASESSKGAPKIAPIPHARNVSAINASLEDAHESLVEISRDPFQAMVEFEQVSRSGSTSMQLCYINENTSTNESVAGEMVMRWTNAIAQVALRKPFAERVHVEGTIVSPTLRAWFTQTLPNIAGEYEDATGTIEDFTQPRQSEPTQSSRSLKSIKLGMTSEQVDAFIGKVSGYMLIQGAPGTGKTTVALQRIRYILDADGDSERRLPLSHSAETTVVFVPSKAVVSHIEHLLADLDLSTALVANIQDYIRQYVEQKWNRRLSALYVADPFDHRERSGRRAYYGLCVVDDLAYLWQRYDEQIIRRLREAESSNWHRGLSTSIRDEMLRLDDLIASLRAEGDDSRADADEDDTAADDDTLELLRNPGESDAAFRKRLMRRKNKLGMPLRDFVSALAPHEDITPQRHPRLSKVRLDDVFARCASQYQRLLNAVSKGQEAPEAAAVKNALTRDIVDWLWWVYDPLFALASYFTTNHEQGFHRVRSGLGDELAARRVCDDIQKELRSVLDQPGERPAARSGRSYRSEQLDWIAWLLQAALPTAASNPTPTFAEQVRRSTDTSDSSAAEKWEYRPLIPFAHMTGRAGRSDSPWHHVVVDEAQDLSVASAAFIAASAHPRGALTVAADFHQTVSPAQGQLDDDAVRFGTRMEFQAAPDEYRFKKNMRQSAAIGAFLQHVFSALFGQKPPFEPNYDGLAGEKPRVLVAGSDGYYSAVASAVAAIRSRGARSIVIATIDDDGGEAAALMERFKEAVTFDGYLSLPQQNNVLVITKAEDIKGFEFDACIILGIDKAEQKELRFYKERTYVALSRAMQHLWIITRVPSDLVSQISSNCFETS